MDAPGRSPRRAASRTRAANSGCVFRPLPTAVPPSGILPRRPRRGLDPRAALAHLRGVAAELLAQRDRDGVHQVRAARLDDVRELLGLRRERRGEQLERRQQLVDDPVERGQVHRRREHVVRRLAHVDVVVRRARPRRRGRRSPRWRSCSTRCPSRSGRRRSGTGRRARRRPPRRRPPRSGRQAGVEQPEVGVHARGGGLDPAQPVHHGRGDRLARDGEVLDRLARLGAPELSCGAADFGLRRARPDWIMCHGSFTEALPITDALGRVRRRVPRSPRGEPPDAGTTLCRGTLREDDRRGSARASPTPQALDLLPALRRAQLRRRPDGHRGRLQAVRPGERHRRSGAAPDLPRDDQGPDRLGAGQQLPPLRVRRRRGRVPSSSARTATAWPGTRPRPAPLDDRGGRTRANEPGA